MEADLLATEQQNSMNRRLYSVNKSGIPGVFWNQQNRRWRAYISVGGEMLHLVFYNLKSRSLRANVRNDFIMVNGQERRKSRVMRKIKMGDKYIDAHAAFQSGKSKRPCGKNEMLVLLALLIDHFEDNYDLWHQLGKIVAMEGCDRFAMMEIEALLKKDAPRKQHEF